VIALALEDVRRLVQGDLRVSPDAGRFTGISVDPYGVGPGDLFVAAGAGPPLASLRRRRRVRIALRRGAAGALSPAGDFELGAIAAAVRERSAARFVGATGSVGKTTTKDMLASLVRPHLRTVSAEESFNNEFGVPLTVCRVEEDTEVCVLEFGMAGFGLIEWLASLSRPQIAIVTSIAPAHLREVGTLAGVARAKAELLDALPPGGVAIVPDEAPDLEPYLQRGDIEVRRFGPSSVRSFELTGELSRIRLKVGAAGVELETPLVARHLAVNLAAALHAYDALGLPLAQAQAGARDIELPPLRLEERPLPGGGLLVDDCYNASPASTLAALEHLADRAAGRRRVAFLGEMHDLGDAEDAYHREVGRRATALGVDEVVAVGRLAAPIAEETGGTWVRDAAAAAARARAIVRPGDCVLVKASRGVRLEAVGQALAAAR
jgi:UDP-N-acetylmuramoyl-tripeptide--D-alanyl-D-alanine ligase